MRAGAVPAACRAADALLQRGLAETEADGSGANDSTLTLPQRVEHAEAAFPACDAVIASVARGLSEQENPMLLARGFLGPVGWLWNNVYYRVFEGSIPNMVLFGAPLFIAPLVLVLAMVAVLSGTRGARRRPQVPEAIRTQVS